MEGKARALGTIREPLHALSQKPALEHRYHHHHHRCLFFSKETDRAWGLPLQVGGAPFLSVPVPGLSDTSHRHCWKQWGILGAPRESWVVRKMLWRPHHYLSHRAGPPCLCLRYLSEPRPERSGAARTPLAVPSSAGRGSFSSEMESGGRAVMNGPHHAPPPSATQLKSRRRRGVLWKSKLNCIPAAITHPIKVTRSPLSFAKFRKCSGVSDPTLHGYF